MRVKPPYIKSNRIAFGHKPDTRGSHTAGNAHRVYASSRGKQPRVDHKVLELPIEEDQPIEEGHVLEEEHPEVDEQPIVEDHPEEDAFYLHNSLIDDYYYYQEYPIGDKISDDIIDLTNDDAENDDAEGQHSRNYVIDLTDDE